MANQVERIKEVGEPWESGVIERLDTFPEAIEKTIPGAQVVPTHFQAQVTDDQGKPLIQTPKTRAVVITLPKAEDVLKEESKGSPDEAKTWLAKFWLRIIEKAKVFGWQIVGLLKKSTV